MYAEDYGVELNLLAILVGFLTYKIAVIARGSKLVRSWCAFLVLGFLFSFEEGTEGKVVLMGLPLDRVAVVCAWLQSGELGGAAVRTAPTKLSRVWECSCQARLAW